MRRGDAEARARIFLPVGSLVPVHRELHPGAECPCIAPRHEGPHGDAFNARQQADAPCRFLIEVHGL
jgi:hypothetical protein